MQIPIFSSMSDQLRIEIKDFRAIKEANIKMNGITVVAGVNGCGKSTLAKLVYNVVDSIIHHDEILIESFEQYLKPIVRFAGVLKHEMPDILPIEWVLKIESNILNQNYNENITNQKVSVKQYFSSAWEMFHKSITDDNRRNRIYNSLATTLFDYAKIVDRDENNNYDQHELISALLDLIDTSFQSLIISHETLSSDLIYTRISKVVFKLSSKINCDFYEFEVPLLSTATRTSPVIYSIDDILYIETPKYIGENLNSDDSYLNVLNNKLKEKSVDTLNRCEFIETLIMNNIIQGDVELETQSSLHFDDFRYKRLDGLIFNLSEVATGVKSFSILQLLLKNGLLTNKTLLIIDEPEAHLHPQWIVEYARVLVLLNKELGVKFLIASHSPDMVSAIRYIRKKEGTLSTLEYYLAEESPENRFQYNYKALGQDIDPIFKSFNIALDRINQYGVSNSDDLF